LFTCYGFDVKLLVALTIAVCLPVACKASSSQWTLVQSPHFQVYSQSGERDGRSALLWFEQLREFFSRMTVSEGGQGLESRGPVRVIGFRSAKEYAAFRPHPATDAYFIGGELTDYIVMPRLSSDEFGVAAHEYAHLFVHSKGLRMPLWLAEGIAEVFSTIRIGENGVAIGGDLPMRTQTLRKRPWIPLAQLLATTVDSPIRVNRDAADVFYAESWAFTQMLLFSSGYRDRFGLLWNVLQSRAGDLETIAHTYGKPLSAIGADLHDWVRQPRSGVRLPGIPNLSQPVQVSQLTSFESRLLIADLLLACADLGRAKQEYLELANEQPGDASVAAALGTIALREGDRSMAREQWERAIQLGIQDPMLCYRYAMLAEDPDLPVADIRRALRRAIELKADFDDARYKLALLECNSGHYKAALEQFQAMRSVPAERAYGYWTAMASALTETDQRKGAKEAAAKAMRYATNALERASAARLAYAAETDLTVRFSRDASGNLQMVTARKPHGMNDWNPFIEPDDHIISVEGQIQKVECRSGKINGFRVATSSAVLEIALPDPSHVLIRGGTPEFVCDERDERKVKIHYAAFENHSAADGLLREIEFR
jgi:tetratricopeptide (TPR) repeat protein